MKKSHLTFILAIVFPYLAHAHFTLKSPLAQSSIAELNCTDVSVEAEKDMYLLYGPLDTVELTSRAACEDTLIVSSNVQTPACHGQCNGIINLTITGGLAPYTFIWSNGSSQQDIGALCDGEYTVTVTDSEKCTATLATVVDVPDTIIITAEITHATHGQSNGSLTAVVTGGTEPYRYTLEEAKTYQLSPTFTDLPAGMYAVSVLDANNCTGMSDSFEIQNLIGISELEQKFIWYPNPATSHLTVESDIPLSLEILDVHGSRLRRAEESLSHHIILEGLRPGMYILQISDKESDVFRKFIILEE